MHSGRTRAPFAGRWVVLHGITMRGGGPVDSTRSDAAGRWRLGVPRVDTTAVYVVSAFADGVAYFSQPVHLMSGRTIVADTLVVYDTSSTGPAVRIRRRLITVASPKQDGARDVLEIVELENPGQATRIAPDTALPTWAGAVPPAALQFQVGTGDFSNDAVARRGDSVLVFGPIQPDGARQLSYGYELAGSERTLALPIDQATGELDLLLEDTLSKVSGAAFHPGGVELVENRRFASYRADSLAAGARVSITFPAPPFRLERIVPLFVVVIVAALGVGLWIALRRGQPLASHEARH